MWSTFDCWLTPFLFAVLLSDICHKGPVFYSFSCIFNCFTLPFVKTEITCIQGLYPFCLALFIIWLTFHLLELITGVYISCGLLGLFRKCLDIAILYPFCLILFGIFFVFAGALFTIHSHFGVPSILTVLGAITGIFWFSLSHINGNIFI